MISKNNNSLHSTGVLRAIILGALSAICVCCITVIIEPIFILNEYIEPKVSQIIAMIIQAIGALLGALIAASGVTDKKWMVACASAGLFYATLICIGVLLFESDLDKIASGAISCTAGATLSIILVSRKIKTSNHKKIKRRYR